MKLSSKLQLFSLAILSLMTVIALAVGMLIINELAQQQHRQLLQVELGKVRTAISDHLNQTGVEAAAEEAKRLQLEIRNELDLQSITIYIVESPDRVIYHPQHKKGDRIQRDDIQALLKQGEGFIEYSYQDINYFAIYTTIQDFDWVIFISLKASEMYANEAEYLRNIIIAFIAIFFFSALAVSYFVRQFSTRLQTTLDSVESIEAGKLDTYIPVTTHDELGMLQTGINNMNANIQARILEQKDAEHALRDSEYKFRSLVHKIHAAVVVHGADTQIISANTMAQKLLGLSEAQLQGKAANDAAWHFLREDGSKMPQEEYPVNQVLATHSVLNNLVVGVARQDRAEPMWALVNALPVSDEGEEVKEVIVSFTDITERKKNEQQLARSEQLFRTLVENSPHHIARYDLNLRRVYVNPALEKQFRIPIGKIIGKTSRDSSPLLDPERYMANLRKVIYSKQEVSDEIAFRTATEEINWASTRFAPEFDIDGNVQSVLVISNNITNEKLAEHERQENIHFLQCLDRVNRVLHEEGNIEQIMHRALEEVRLIFNSDRAFLLYACDPESASYIVPFESTTKEFPGACELGMEVPNDDFLSHLMSTALDLKHPFQMGKGSRYPISNNLKQEFRINSILAMAIHPRVDRPWLIGMHQCSFERIWSNQEVRLFEELAHRLSDALNSLLISRNLQESETRSRQLFENSPVSLQEEDYSGVKIYLDSLRPQYGDNLSEYLAQHEDVLLECAKLVRFIDINHAALVLHEADDKKAALRRLPQIFLPETLGMFRQIVVDLMRGETNIRRESRLQTLKGKKYDMEAFISVSPGYETTLSKILVSLIDITPLKKAELERQQHLHFLESLDRVNQVLNSEGNTEEILSRILDVVLDIFDCDRAYLQYPCDPDASSEWLMPMERFKPEFPTPFKPGDNLPYHPHIAQTLQALLDSDTPVKLGPNTDRPIPPEITENLGVRSLMATALYPKVDRPWQFGIHQCSNDRIWTEQESRLLEEISHRLSDGLNDLLVMQSLRESEERFRLVYENSPVSIWVEDFSAVKQRLDSLNLTLDSDIDTHLKAHPDVVKELAVLVKIVDINSATLDLHEAGSKDELYEGLHKTFLPESYDAFRKELVALSRGETELLFDGAVQTLKGQRREVTVSFSVCPGYEDSLSKVFVSLFDITQRKNDEESLRLAASVFSTSQEGILISDAANNIIDINPAFTHLTGYSRKEALGRNPKFLSSGRQGPSFYSDMWEQINTTGEWHGEVWNQRKSGEVFPELLSVVAVKNDQGVLQHYVGAFSDISMIKQHEADLDRIAHYDMLTSVPNRRLLRDRLDQSIAHTIRHGNNLAVCYLDLDGFKPINDQFGHEAGDRMLIQTARRLESMSRAEDTVARLGGDEFVLLWNDIGSKSDCVHALHRVLETISQPIHLNGEAISVSASIGVTLYPDDKVDADSLLRHADHAMYTAKQLGKNRYQIFDARLERQITARLELLNKIASGLDSDQFELYYQPKINCSNGDIDGVEALLRWNDPVLGLVGPKEFLSLIENESLELRLGRWVISQAVIQAKAWDEQDIKLPISINVFPRHLKYHTFISDLRDVIDKEWPEMPEKRLKIEIIETAALEDLDSIEEVITSCAEMGIGFSLDDFGTGYSSLVYLRKLSIEELKIDQSFVRDMLDDKDDEAIVISVIGLGKTFGLKVVAEGVESTQQADHLMKLGCTIAQGYGIGRPMPPQAFRKWLKNHISKESSSCQQRS